VKEEKEAVFLSIDAGPAFSVFFSCASLVSALLLF